MLSASDERVDHNWLAGYLVAQRQLTAANRFAPLLLKCWGEAVFARWLRRTRPDAIISKCAEALPALRRLGYRLPQALGAAFLTKVKPTRDTSGVTEMPLEAGAPTPRRQDPTRRAGPLLRHDREKMLQRIRRQLRARPRQRKLEGMRRPRQRDIHMRHPRLREFAV